MSVIKLVSLSLAISRLSRLLALFNLHSLLRKRNSRNILGFHGIGGRRSKWKPRRKTIEVDRRLAYTWNCGLGTTVMPNRTRFDALRPKIRPATHKPEAASDRLRAAYRMSGIPSISSRNSNPSQISTLVASNLFPLSAISQRPSRQNDYVFR